MPKLIKHNQPSTNPLSNFWSQWPKSYWTHPQQKVQLYLGDVLEQLRTFPSKSVQMAVTSPPYWGLRDYGICSCRKGRIQHETSTLVGSQAGTPEHFGSPDPDCPKCLGTGKLIGMERQLGSERVPDCLGWARGTNCAEQNWSTGCHVCRMVLVFRELRRVLRDDGTLWLNYGDTYAAGSGSYRESRTEETITDAVRGYTSAYKDRVARQGGGGQFAIEVDTGLAPGNTCGIPWRIAFALQADGWILRQDIIWHKPSAMPESVISRCTKSHEYVFMLTKSMDYYFDNNAIKENAVTSWNSKKTFGTPKAKGPLSDDQRELQRTRFADNTYHPDIEQNERNKRSVWTVATEPIGGIHFAAFPTALIDPCICASTSAYGACANCGNPYMRVVRKQQLLRYRPNDYVKYQGQDGTGNSCAASVAGTSTQTIGWQKDCNCRTDEVVPCVVLDPFMGSGTTAQVCIERGRRAVGIDLSEEYIKECAVQRISDAEVVQSDPLEVVKPVTVQRGSVQPIDFES